MKALIPLLLLISCAIAGAPDLSLPPVYSAVLARPNVTAASALAPLGAAETQVEQNAAAAGYTLARAYVRAELFTVDDPKKPDLIVLYTAGRAVGVFFGEVGDPNLIDQLVRESLTTGAAVATVGAYVLVAGKSAPVTYALFVRGDLQQLWIGKLFSSSLQDATADGLFSTEARRAL